MLDALVPQWFSLACRIKYRAANFSSIGFGSRVEEKYSWHWFIKEIVIR
jgi:hypothetical protein